MTEGRLLQALPLRSGHGELADGQTIKLMRLRYGGSASIWGFALYVASTDKYEDTILPTGGFAGTPEDALD